ncbi:MAG: outer membrane beta-barrel protein, partial [Proteobacteria bacterium]|nr:outer membrane beta-barrel protein [Pseudomonadota bacterium]
MVIDLDHCDSSLPANTLIAPTVVDGTAQASVTQDMGRFDGKLTLDGRRYMMGATTLNDLSTVDNTHRSYWEGGATLRLGYEITPLISAFVEGEASVQKFDAPDPTVLAYLDGREYQLRAGLSYTYGSIISAEASVGRGWLDYVDGALTDTQSWVYNGSLTFRPDETVSLTGALETTLDPSTSTPGDTDMGVTLSGNAAYRVNPWLTLRASSAWDRTVT